MPKVSIIIPVHNQIDFTKKAIESLYQFTNEKDFELIVVDNGSMDGTIDYLMEMNKSNLYFKEMGFNAGWGKGLNEVYKHLSPDSEFVLWANNDILFEKDWFPKMLAHFRPGIGAVGPTSNYVNGRQRIELNDGKWEEEVQWLIGFFLMFRRGVIDAIGDVDERFNEGGCEEWDYIIRMQKKLGLKCVIARDVYIHHFGSQTIMNTVCHNEEEYHQYCQKMIDILENKWDKKFISEWLPQKITVSQAQTERSPWPSNCLLGLAIPHTWPNINYVTHLSLMGMKKPNMIILEAGSGGELDQKREFQIEKGLIQGCTHIFVADGDMRYPNNILIDLFKVLEEGADLAGGLCYRGYPPYDPIAWHPTEHRMLIPFKDYKFGDVIDSGAMGGACLLVKRGVFEKLSRPWFKNREEIAINDNGEEWIDYQEGDNYFTRKATGAGFKLRIFTKYDVDHMREFPVNRDLWLTHGLLSRCGDWGTIIALFKKLGDRKWIEREINGASTEIDWPITQKHYEISTLYQLLLGKKVKIVLEIGSQKGGTARLWANLVKPYQGHVYSIDQAFKGQMVYQGTDLEDMITEIKGDSHGHAVIQKVSELISDNGGPVDFLFIDGDHSLAGVKADFEAYAPMVKPGGFIAIHDILDTEWNRKQNCHVADFWNSIKEKYNHFEIVDPNDRNWSGIGVLEWKEV
jgi:glycosyltransferase involved in cell wall biosynthesis/cephalosporin hydroxylase